MRYIDLLNTKLFDNKLKNKTQLVAIGQTAMMLLGFTKTTDDLDFNIPNKEDYLIFKTLYIQLKANFPKIDICSENSIFSTFVPEDYINKILLYRLYNNIELYILNPIDIICTKIAAGRETDVEDIKIMQKKYHFKREEILRRLKEYQFAGNDNIAFKNFDAVSYLFN